MVLACLVACALLCCCATLAPLNHHQATARPIRSISNATPSPACSCIFMQGVCLEPPAIFYEFCARGSLADVLAEAADNPKAALQLTWGVRLQMVVGTGSGSFPLALQLPAGRRQPMHASPSSESACALMCPRPLQMTDPLTDHCICCTATQPALPCPALRSDGGCRRRPAVPAPARSARYPQVRHCVFALLTHFFTLPVIRGRDPECAQLGMDCFGAPLAQQRGRLVLCF